VLLRDPYVATHPWSMLVCTRHELIVDWCYRCGCIQICYAAGQVNFFPRGTLPGTDLQFGKHGDQVYAGNEFAPPCVDTP
jgi:hypothetical protein